MWIVTDIDWGFCPPILQEGTDFPSLSCNIVRLKQMFIKVDDAYEKDKSRERECMRIEQILCPPVSVNFNSTRASSTFPIIPKLPISIRLIVAQQRRQYESNYTVQHEIKYVTHNQRIAPVNIAIPMLHESCASTVGYVV